MQEHHMPSILHPWSPTVTTILRNNCYSPFFSGEETEAPRRKLPEDIQWSVTDPGSFPLKHSTSPWNMAISALIGSELPITGGMQERWSLSEDTVDLISSSVRRIRLDALDSPCQLWNSMNLRKMKIKEGMALFRHILKSIFISVISFIYIWALLWTRTGHKVT